MKYFIKTWGCQMNVLDSDKMAGILLGLGYTPAKEVKDADVVLFNTCSVREGPENKVFTELGRLKALKKRKNVVIGLVGCVAQQEKERIFKRAPFVDLVMGPGSVGRLPGLLAQAQRRNAIDTHFYDDSILFPASSISRSLKTKAYVTVMEGCNKRCTYCIVPSTRGREVNRPLESILSEIRRAVDDGYREIELLGQNVNCWKHGGKAFTDLLAAAGDVPGVKRLRFTTSHPRHFPLAAADLMAERENICPYLHLPVQAGSDRILKAMRRQYDRAWYLDLVEEIRKRVAGIALSSDFIVGFPGETEADFEDTLDVVRRVEYDTLFSFRYSPRPGTPASKMDAVDAVVARERHQRLLNLQRKIQARRFAAYTGRVVEVLNEGESKRGGQFMGRTECNKVVNFTAESRPAVNSFAMVLITRASVNSLGGVMVEEP